MSSKVSHACAHFPSRDRKGAVVQVIKHMPPNDSRLELLQGTLDMLVLRTLQWGPQHGHGIGQAIRQSSAELLQIERGSLYPALHRLEARGLISAEWKSSDLNRRAKYYRLTAAGKKQLVAEQSKWKLLVKAIARVMRPAQGEHE
jgi:PadR family transcriptional regulator, regulatory protein PadR